MKFLFFAFSLSLFLVSIMGCEEFENSAVPSQETLLPNSPCMVLPALICPVPPPPTLTKG